MIYLDSAATTLQKPPSVPQAVAQALATMTSPGRGNYGPAARASQTLLACREAAAERFRVDQPERVVLTFNATHGLNIAVRSLIKPGQTVVLSGYEHNAVTRPLAMIPGVRVKLVKAPLFRPDLFLEEFVRQLTGEVDAAVFTHVSNVFGYALPMEQAAALCRRNGVPFLVDASQSAGVLPVPMDGWGAEFIAMPGHKGLYGPGHGPAPVPGERDASAGRRHGQSLPPGGDAALSARPVGSRDPQRPRRSGFAGGSAVSAQAGAGVHSPPGGGPHRRGFPGCRRSRSMPPRGQGSRQESCPSACRRRTPAGWRRRSAAGASPSGRGCTALPWLTPPGARSKPGRSVSASLPSTPAGRSRPFWQPCRPWYKTPQGCA